MINQGEVYWLQPDDHPAEQPEAESGIRHPYVVLQEDVFNHSRITTVIVCAVTSNLKRANWPGNVLLEVGEANLSKPSVVEVAKVSTVEKTRLGGYIGMLTPQRVTEILDGMRFLQRSSFTR